MNKFRTFVVGWALVWAATGVAMAQPQGGSEPRQEGKKAAIFKELNLTPEQQKKLEENREAQRQEMQALRTALRDEQKKLREALKDPKATRTSVEPAANNLKSLQGRLIDHRINGIFAVKEILTPEQFAKFQEAAEKRMEQRKNRFEKFRERKEAASQGEETK